MKPQSQPQPQPQDSLPLQSPLRPPPPPLPTSPAALLAASRTHTHTHTTNIYARHKDIQIQALTEDLDERNAIIEELREELDQYLHPHSNGNSNSNGYGSSSSSRNGNSNGHVNASGKSNGNRSNHGSKKMQMQGDHVQQADKIKIKYMENIIHDLEDKLRRTRIKDTAPTHHANMNMNGCAPGTSRIGMMPPPSHVPLPKHRYGSIGYFGSSSYGSMGSLGVGFGGQSVQSVNGNGNGGLSPTRVAPTPRSILAGALESNMLDDMELKIAELTERLKDSEEEKVARRINK